MAIRKKYRNALNVCVALVNLTQYAFGAMRLPTFIFYAIYNVDDIG